MLTQMELNRNVLRITISGACDHGTVRSCIHKFVEIGAGRIDALHITLVALQGVPVCLLGLMLWLKEKAGGVRSHLTLSNCDIKLWKLLSMTEILECYVGDGLNNTAINCDCLESATPLRECRDCMSSPAVAGNPRPEHSRPVSF